MVSCPWQHKGFSIFIHPIGIPSIVGGTTAAAELIGYDKLIYLVHGYNNNKEIAKRTYYFQVRRLRK